MANITAADVNKLRQITGAGMMDCKKALIESDGDFEQAIDNLRKKGQKVASNRQDRAANEGFVVAKITADTTFGAVIMLNCETDFVAKNQEFIDFANKFVNVAITEKPLDLETLKTLKVDNRSINDHITDLIGKIGEKIELSRYDFVKAEKVIAYNHQGNRLATIVGFSKKGDIALDSVGREIAMQIAAMSPVAIDKEDVDSKIIEHEIEIGKEQAREEGKAEEMLEKIALGKLNKFYQENTLLNQQYTRDSKKTIRQFLAEYDKDIRVTGFKRTQLGV